MGVVIGNRLFLSMYSQKTNSNRSNVVCPVVAYEEWIGLLDSLFLRKALFLRKYYKKDISLLFSLVSYKLRGIVWLKVRIEIKMKEQWLLKFAQ